MPEPAPLARRDVLRVAWPMVFANAAVPLAGVVDTAVLGAVGDDVDLGGVALGTTIFNVLYLSFYFLRMSSTGLAAQASGAGDRVEMARVLVRAVALGAAVGAALVVARPAISALAFRVLQGGAAVEAVGADYFLARAWGAPGALVGFAVTGWLIGLGRTREVLAVHVVQSATNAALDLVLVLGLGAGVAGVGAATAVADVVGAAAGLTVALRRGAARDALGRALDRAALLRVAALRRVFGVQRDLMVRSWALLLGFAWFTNAAAALRTDVLAGTHVLLQVVSVWAFVLDAFAFTAEREVGRAFGAGSVPRLRRAIRLTTELSLASGVALAAATLWLGPPVLDVWIADPAARAAARHFLPWCAAIPLLGAPAWQLDGVFVGATRSAAMRNATVVAVVLYLLLDRALTPRLGAEGLWTAFLGFYVARALTLGAAYPALERALTAPRPPPAR